MKIQMLMSVAGTGGFVEGFEHEFGLEVGMVAEVEDSTALKWIDSGIAKPVEREESAAAATTPEVAALQHSPERAARVRPAPRRTGRERTKS